jgi:hypothetical protein
MYDLRILEEASRELARLDKGVGRRKVERHRNDGAPLARSWLLTWAVSLSKFLTIGITEVILPL